MSNRTKQALWTVAMVCLVAVIQFLSGCASEKAARGITPLSGAQVPSVLSPLPSQVIGGLAPDSASTRSISAPLGADELWVIARSSASPAAPADDTPGSGALMTEIEGKQVPMPLKHTDVRATVSGYIGAVEVVQ